MRQVEVRHLCDMPVDGGSCGNVCAEDSTVQFGYKGKTYEFDLCAKHTKAFASTMEPLIGAALPVKSTGVTRSSVRKAVTGRPGTFTSKDVREWLAQQGREGEVSSHGRLPSKIVEEFEVATGRA